MREIRIAGQPGGARVGAPVQAEARDHFARMTEPPSALFRDTVNWMVWRWKAQGTWPLIKGLNIHAADTHQASLLSVIGDTPRDAVVVGATPTFTPLKGYSGLDATHGIKWPITSDILVNDAVCCFLAGIITNTGAADGSIIESDAGAGAVTTPGHFSTGSVSANIYGPGTYLLTALNAGQSIPVVVGSGAGSERIFANTAFSPSSANQGAATARSSNYKTSPRASHPLTRLCAYGFLAHTATTAQRRKFMAVLAEGMDMLGALD